MILLWNQGRLLSSVFSSWWCFHQSYSYACRNRSPQSQYGVSFFVMSIPSLEIVPTSWWEKSSNSTPYTVNFERSRSVEDLKRNHTIKKLERKEIGARHNDFKINWFEIFVSLNDGISLLLGTFFAKELLTLVFGIGKLNFLFGSK